MKKVTFISILVAICALVPSLAFALLINVQPVQLCLDDGTGCAGVGPVGNEYYEAETDKIWAQAGIDINFLGLQQWNSTTFLTPDSTTSGATDSDDTMRAAGAAMFGAIADTMIIPIYFVADYITDPGFVLYGSGCGHPTFDAFCNSTEGVIINDLIFDIGRIDTIAHELGHVLGLTHNGFGAGDTSPENLMTRGSRRTVPGSIDDIFPDGADLSQLTQAQLDEVFLDPHGVIKVPEPSSLVLLVLGLLGFAFARSRTAG